jgi:hypothetical protein
MATNIYDALENVKHIYMSDSALATLLDFERVIDELDVYAFENWRMGELVEGPIYEKYFITCSFMWPHKKMPNPRGGEQLLNYNCEVVYKKDTLEYPVKPKNPDDFRPGTKMPKTKTIPVWIVSITIPKQLMDDIQQGSIELENEQLDLDELERSYEEGVDEEETQIDDEGQQAPPGDDMGGGGMGQPPQPGGGMMGGMGGGM